MKNNGVFKQHIQAIILDDEIDACKNLEILISQKWQGIVEIIAIANSTEQAEEIIKSRLPDVLFLDIEMPGENAFQFLERLGKIPFEIIFVTAYDEYALRALKLNAIDYILKPICNEELDEAILKLQQKLLITNKANIYQNNENIVQFLGQIKKKTKPDSIVLKTKSGTIIVPFSKLLYLKADGNYTQMFFEKEGKTEEHLMYNSLSHYEEIITDSLFFRTHKSYIVNTNYIQKVLKIEQCLIELKDGTTLPLSRRRYHGLLEFIKIFNSQI